MLHIRFIFSGFFYQKSAVYIVLEGLEEFGYAGCDQTELYIFQEVLFFIFYMEINKLNPNLYISVVHH